MGDRVGSGNKLAISFSRPNALNILNKCNIYSITRIEKSLLVHKDIYDDSMLDPMTQRIYTHPISTFEVLKEIKEMYEVKDIDIENKKYKLGFDKQDIKRSVYPQ